MPLYEYICQDCNEKFEALRSFNQANEPIACPICESERTLRLISVFFAQSDSRVIAGGNNACISCSSNSCATCK